MYYFVWILNYRHKVFVETYFEPMKASILKVGYDYDFDIQELYPWSMKMLDFV